MITRDLLLLYYSKLPWLEDLLPRDSRTDETAEEWLKKIDLITCSRASDAFMMAGFSVACSVIESVGVSRGFEVHGYTQAMTHNPQVPELLTLIRLRNIHVFKEVTPGSTVSQL